jgi:hypothetical protein
VEGPPDDTLQAKSELEKVARDLISRLSFAEIQIDPKYHRHIIGKQGANSELCKVLLRL